MWDWYHWKEEGSFFMILINSFTCLTIPASFVWEGLYTCLYNLLTILFLYLAFLLPMIFHFIFCFFVIYFLILETGHVTVDSICNFCVLDAENYRLDTEYENHLIYKVALVIKKNSLHFQWIELLDVLW